MPVGWKATVTVITPLKQELDTHQRVADGRMLVDYDYDMTKKKAEELASFGILYAIEKECINGGPLRARFSPQFYEQLEDKIVD